MRWNEIELPKIVYHGTTAEQWNLSQGKRLDWTADDATAGLHVARSPVLPEDYAQSRARAEGETPILISFALADLKAAGLQFAPNELHKSEGRCHDWDDCLANYGVMLVLGFSDEHKRLGKVTRLKPKKWR
jgi:hypothetical protein